jgi:hypothetical protein
MNSTSWALKMSCILSMSLGIGLLSQTIHQSEGGKLSTAVLSSLI